MHHAAWHVFCDYCESERRRDLSDGKGGIIKAVDVQRVSLCGLADLVAIIVDDAQQIPDERLLAKAGKTKKQILLIAYSVKREFKGTGHASLCVVSPKQKSRQKATGDIWMAQENNKLTQRTRSSRHGYCGKHSLIDSRYRDSPLR